MNREEYENRKKILWDQHLEIISKFIQDDTLSWGHYTPDGVKRYRPEDFHLKEDKKRGTKKSRCIEFLLAGKPESELNQEHKNCPNSLPRFTGAAW